MKKLNLVLFFLTGILALSEAQRPESVITEASEPIDSSIFMDDIVKRRTIVDQRVLPYEGLREADIPWEKRVWQVIDVREKMNLAFVYPKQPLFQILNDAATSGMVAAFREEDFKEFMQAVEIEGMMFSMDTIQVIDPETYETKTQIVKNEISSASIKFFRIKEIWFFDREASRMRVRILGIAPIRERIIAGKAEEQAMYWLYYPQIRDILARHRAFNDFNDASPLSWDDVFEMRRFSSYIYKESNAQDLRLKDFFPLDGVARLREGEKIKNKLFNFEQDLWEY
ncbi:MAG: gliding motility protein GldN [Saprospiraceae bacterium]|nr:gliding motility protein GldN [Saprospiraceae bacterium]